MILQKNSSVFVASESHQACAQMRHALWKSIFVCTFVRFPHLVCLVCLDKGGNLSRCLCPGSRPIFCLACNSPLTDSQAVASWKFVAKVSILLWLVTIDQIDLKVLVQHIIQREEPLYSHMIMCQGSPSASLSCYPAQGVSNVKVLTDVHSVTQPALFIDIPMSDPPLTRRTILR